MMSPKMPTPQKAMMTQIGAVAAKLQNIANTGGNTRRNMTAVFRKIGIAHDELSALLLRAKMLAFAEKFPKGLVGIRYNVERVENGSETILTACDPCLVFRIRRGQEFDLPVAGLEYDWDDLDGNAQAFLYGGSVAGVDYEDFSQKMVQRFPRPESVLRFAEEIHHLSGEASYRLYT